MTIYPRAHLKAASVLAAVLVIVVATLPAQQQTLPSAPVSLKVTPKVDTPSGDKESAREASTILLASGPPSTSSWIHIEVESGDNLARIFQRMKLPAADLQNIIDLGQDVSSLTKILPGQELSLHLSATNKLISVEYKKNALETLVISRVGEGFKADWKFVKPEKIVVFTAATITRDNPSLYHAGKAAGLSDNVIMKLSYIFQWDISFALDLRAADSFSLMYEEIYVDGEKVEEGDIVAASFTNMGKTYDAVRYTDISGDASYYTPSGLSMRKAFLRDPVHFSHVSSSFNLRRLHPIHKRVMPHRGIDYAARKGTPVVSAGDGKISVRRHNDASGKYIVIQHGEQYTTKYLHLSAYARGVKPGKSVKQGQTIGYVGATGWATAAHLHYEFLVDGVHRNPKTVSLPKASPISTDELKRFNATILPVMAKFEAISGKGYATVLPVDRTTGG